jgi:colicin import membrane protein
LEAQRQVAELTDSAHTAQGRAEEIEKRAADLRRSLDAAEAALRDQTAAAASQLAASRAELDAERNQLGTARARTEALATELATVKARAEAQASVQLDQVERLKRLEADLTQTRGAAAAAREDAAQLRGQAETLQAQHAELMEALKLREPKGGKKST